MRRVLGLYSMAVGQNAACQTVEGVIFERRPVTDRIGLPDTAAQAVVLIQVLALALCTGIEPLNTFSLPKAL